MVKVDDGTSIGCPGPVFELAGGVMAVEEMTLVAGLPMVNVEDGASIGCPVPVFELAGGVTAVDTDVRSVPVCSEEPELKGKPVLMPEVAGVRVTPVVLANAGLELNSGRPVLTLEVGRAVAVFTGSELPWLVVNGVPPRVLVTDEGPDCEAAGIVGAVAVVLGSDVTPVEPAVVPGPVKLEWGPAEDAAPVDDPDEAGLEGSVWPEDGPGADDSGWTGVVVGAVRMEVPNNTVVECVPVDGSEVTPGVLDPTVVVPKLEAGVVKVPVGVDDLPSTGITTRGIEVDAFSEDDSAAYLVKESRDDGMTMLEPDKVEYSGRGGADGAPSDPSCVLPSCKS